MGSEGLFEGPERLQFIDALGRKVRAGTPEQTRASDVEVIRQRLLDGDVDEASERLQLVARQYHVFMVWTYGEWSLQMADTFVETVGSADELAAILPDVYRQWRRDTSAMELGDHARPVFDLVAEALEPAGFRPDSAARFRTALANGAPTVLDDVARAVEERYDELSRLVAAEELEAAAADLDLYYDVARTPHDAFAQWVTTFPGVVLDQYGQGAAERMVDESFAGCSFHAGLFELADSLTPEERAAWLADHLRAHFTGPNRQGSVLVVEEDDRYRLVMDPCGSGGAIRRRLGEDLPRLPAGSPMTWHREGEVPTYCTHCAFNEIYSRRTLGYEIMFTEFHPDPSAPCTWVVRKSEYD